MNALCHLGRAGELIEEVYAGEPGRWILYVHNHELKLKAEAHKEPVDYVLVYLTSFEINSHPMDSACNRIYLAIERAIRKGVLG